MTIKKNKTRIFFYTDKKCFLALLPWKYFYETLTHRLLISSDVKWWWYARKMGWESALMLKNKLWIYIVVVFFIFIIFDDLRNVIKWLWKNENELKGTRIDRLDAGLLAVDLFLYGTKKKLSSLPCLTKLRHSNQAILFGQSLLKNRLISSRTLGNYLLFGTNND